MHVIIICKEINTVYSIPTVLQINTSSSTLHLKLPLVEESSTPLLSSRLLPNSWKWSLLGHFDHVAIASRSPNHAGRALQLLKITSHQRQGGWTWRCWFSGECQLWIDGWYVRNTSMISDKRLPSAMIATRYSRTWSLPISKACITSPATNATTELVVWRVEGHISQHFTLGTLRRPCRVGHKLPHTHMY